MDSGYGSRKRKHITSRNYAKPRNPFNVVGAVKAGVGAYKVYKKIKSAWTVTPNENAAAGGITTQNDVQLQYKRGKRRGKGQSKFAKKVQKVLRKQIAPRTIVLNDTISQTIAAATDTQNICAAVCMGAYGVADNTALEVGTRDLFTIRANDADIDEASENFNVTTSILDITFCNTGACPLEVDVYSVVNSRNSEHLSSPMTEATTAETQTPSIGGATSLTFGVRGVTPFDFPIYAKQGNTIISKTKHFVAASGGVFTSQWRNNKQRVIKGQVLTNQSGTNYAYENYTRYYFFVVKKVVGNAATAAAWSVGCTRKYIYKPLSSQNKTYDGVL